MISLLLDITLDLAYWGVKRVLLTTYGCSRWLWDRFHEKPRTLALPASPGASAIEAEFQDQLTYLYRVKWMAKCLHDHNTRLMASEMDDFKWDSGRSVVFLDYHHGYAIATTPVIYFKSVGDLRRGLSEISGLCLGLHRAEWVDEALTLIEDDRMFDDLESDAGGRIIINVKLELGNK